MANAKQLISSGLTDNPEVELVLEIAARARATQDQEFPNDRTSYTEVVANPVWGTIRNLVTAMKGGPA